MPSIHLRNKNLFFYCLILLLYLFRFIVGVTTEIVGWPYDTAYLAHLITVGYWGGFQAPMRPPTMPLIGFLIMKTGIPYRVFLEIALLCSASWLMLLVKKHFGMIASLATTIALIFNPYTIYGFNVGSREPLLVILYLFLFCFLLWGLESQKKGGIFPAVFLSVLAAIISLTREGEYIFAGFILIFYFFSSIALEQFNARRTLTFVLLLSIPALSIFTAVSYFNKKQFGISGRNGIFDHYLPLLDRLNHIDPGDSTRFIPITRTSLQLAASVSPTFSELGLHSSSKRGEPYDALRGLTFFYTGNSGIGFDSPGLLWAIHAAASQRYGNEALKATKLKIASQEIERALHLGLIPKHSLPAFYPLDPNIRNWVSQFPGSIWKLINFALFESGRTTIFYSGHLYELGQLEDYQPLIFNKAFNRRVDLIAKQFTGPLHKTRKLLVLIHPYILFGICILLLFVPSKPLAPVANLWLCLAYGYLFIRITVTAVIFSSVLPVPRFFTFSAPLISFFIPLFILALCPKLRAVAPRKRKSHS